MNAEWFRVVEAAVEAVHGAAADRGLVVVLDDMHRGDEPSLLILRHLADRLAASRIALGPDPVGTPELIRVDLARSCVPEPVG